MRPGETRSYLQLLGGSESSPPDEPDLGSVRPASLTLIFALPSSGSQKEGDAPDPALIEGLLGPSQRTGEVVVEGGTCLSTTVRRHCQS